MTRHTPLLWFTLAMVLVIVSSNILVQHPLNDWLTWGAITYPFAFLVSTLFGSVVDTAVFFTVAFHGTDMPWVTLAFGDLGVKIALALVTLLPFRAALALYRPSA